MTRHEGATVLTFRGGGRSAPSPHAFALRDEERGDIPFDRLQCPELASIGRAWIDMPRLPGEPLPRWRAFRLSEFVKVIDRLCVLLVEEGDMDRIEFTVCGQHVTDTIGQGKPLSLAAMQGDPQRSADHADIRLRAARALSENAPQYARKALSWRGADYLEYETLMLPFMAENGSQRILQPASAHAWQRRGTL